MAQDFKQQIRKVDVPLVVDLDGTLLLTDVLMESLNSHFSKSPLSIVTISKWMSSGRQVLKHNLAQQIDLETEYLPLNSEVVEFLRRRKQLVENLY